jgi:hypothetical protein
MKNVFIQKTKDAIEQLYGLEVVRLFPNYSIFWEEFIGDPKKDTPIPYGLLFPPGIEAKRRGQIEEIYHEICMAHYSLFCHLAGAHFQLKNLEEALKLNDSKRKYFEHWEAFEVCYFHLGSALYQMYHLWGLIFRLKKDKKGSIKSKLKDYLVKASQGFLCTKIDELDDGIKNLRDHIVHFSRGASEVHFGEFYIPLKITRETWEKQHKSEEWLETSRKIKKDLQDTEKLINGIHNFLIKEFREFLKTNNLRVNREEDA